MPPFQYPRSADILGDGGHDRGDFTRAAAPASGGACGGPAQRPLFLLPGPFVASSVTHANQELEGDYQDKCLDSVRINSQLRSHQGVVFFKIPEKLRGSFDMEDAFLEVKIYKQGKGDQLGKVFDLPVHFR